MKINNLTLPFKRVDYRWLNLSEKEINKIKNKFKILSPKAKEYFEMTPFISIVLTQKCTLKCAYCGEGGEGTNSKKAFHNIEILGDNIKKSLEMGVKKIRLTGGEPFLYPKLKELLKMLKDLKRNYSFFLLLNTNGTVPTVESFIPLLKELETKVAVHIDTVNEEKYIEITNGNKIFFNTLIKKYKTSKRK